MPLGKRRRSGGGPMRKKKRTYSQRTKFGKYARRASLASKIKNVIRRVSETKYKVLGVDEGAIYHNNSNAMGLWYPGAGVGGSIWPDQGNTDHNREGDRIYCDKVVVRGVLTIPDDRKNVMVKVFWVPHNNTQGTPNSKTDFFHMQLNNWAISPVQYKRWPGARLLKTYRCTPRNSSDTGAVENTIHMKMTIPMNKNVFFNGDASTNPANLPEYGYLIAWAYDTTSSNSATDIVIAKWQCSATLYFKDI